VYKEHGAADDGPPERSHARRLLPPRQSGERPGPTRESAVPAGGPGTGLGHYTGQGIQGNQSIVIYMYTCIYMCTCS